MLKLFRARSGQPGPPAGPRSPIASPDRAKLALLVFTVAALSAVMCLRLRPDRISLQLGELSPREIRAGRSVTYVDYTKTAHLQQAAMQAVLPVYDRDDRASADAIRTCDQIFDRMEAERAPIANAIPLSRRRLEQAVASAQFASSLPQAAIRRFLTAPPALFQKIHDAAARVVADAMSREIRDDGPDLRLARGSIASALSDSLADPEDQAIARWVADQSIRPNRLLDPQRTQMARQAAKRAVPQVVGRVWMGDPILRQGEPVTQEALDKLAALGLVDPTQEISTNTAICLLAGVMVLLVAIYIARWLPALYRQTRRLALLSTIVIVSVLGLKVGAALLGLSVSGVQVGYLAMANVAAAGMLVAVLLDTHLALLIVALLAVQSGILMNQEIRFTVMTLMGSLVAIACVKSPGRRVHLLGVTGALALMNVCMVALLGLLFADALPEVLRGIAWAAGAAALATFLFWIGLLLLEKPFGILTHTSLVELASSDSPLLRKLCAVAPGTYAHSMMVGSLAEAAAQAISADALLCRAAGYYHDIGKMNQPDFFVENQRHENVHARLSPSLSALIIIAHVRDGVQMAREERLPIEIQEIIAQHHGTTLISYFYHQALADNGAGGPPPPGLEQRFRYAGPKPQTAEAAIVMMADSIEAAARCLERPNQEQLKDLVAEIIQGKIQDGQLDECPLTFQMVRLVSDAFLHVLKAMMHGRIHYPKALSPGAVIGKPQPAVARAIGERTAVRSAPAQDPEPGLGGTPAVPVPENAPWSVVEPEELYVHSGVELAEATRANSSVEGGPSPVAPERKAGERGGERSPR